MPLDPQCQALIDAADSAGIPFSQGDHLAVRAAYAGTAKFYRHPTPGLAAVENRRFSGPGGEIPLRVYRPQTESTAPPPCLVYFHGGGWVVGDLETHDHVCRYLAAKAGIVVVAVDYRLAPEHKFPAAVHDCVASVRWAVAHAAPLQIDPARIAISGDSAGGNLAAASAIVLRDHGGPRIALQLLIYPAVDFTADNSSLHENASGYLLTRADLEMFTDWYLPNREARSYPLASPLLRNHHAGLPRAFVQTAEFDPLRDEARAYAQALIAGGVPVEYKCYPGMVHGFIRMGAKIDGAITALDDASALLREALNSNV